MPDLTRPARNGGSPATSGNPVHAAPRPAVRPGFHLIPHEPICPQCGSFEVVTDEVDTGDGITETAFICEPCGCAWPLACVCEWR